MSLTKDNFESQFRDQTIADAEFREREEHNARPLFYQMPDCITHLNQTKGVRLKGRIVNNKNPKFDNHPRAVIWGTYKGVVMHQNNHTVRKLISIIQSYGMTVLKAAIDEDEKEKTQLTFTIKNQ